MLYKNLRVQNSARKVSKEVFKVSQLGISSCLLTPWKTSPAIAWWPGVLTWCACSNVKCAPSYLSADSDWNWSGKSMWYIFHDAQILYHIVSLLWLSAKEFLVVIWLEVMLDVANAFFIKGHVYVFFIQGDACGGWWIFYPQYYSPDAKWVTSASLTCLALSYTVLISGDDDIYIMMKCLSVCNEKWALPPGSLL